MRHGIPPLGNHIERMKPLDLHRRVFFDAVIRRNDRPSLFKEASYAMAAYGAQHRWDRGGAGNDDADAAKNNHKQPTTPEGIRNGMFGLEINNTCVGVSGTCQESDLADKKRNTKSHKDESHRQRNAKQQFHRSV